LIGSKEFYSCIERFCIGISVVEKNSKKMVIEHLNRDFKIFRICGTKYRGKHKNDQETWQLVAAIINLKKATKNMKYTAFSLERCLMKK
jgi:hypothetical protein